MNSPEAPALTKTRGSDNRSGNGATRDLTATEAAVIDATRRRSVIFAPADNTGTRSRPLPDDIIIRGYDPDLDRNAIRNFQCARPREPWTIGAEETVRRDIIPLVAAGAMTALVAATRDGTVVGVIGTRPDNNRERSTNSHILAVTVSRQRENVGYNLKAVAAANCRIDNQRELWSDVDPDNTAMRATNACFAATEFAVTADPDFLLSVVYLPA